jgi:hypothetical protein
LRLTIYDWRAWHQFMLVRMVPEGIRLTARVGESAVEVLGRLPTSVDAFAFHLNMTHTAAVPTDRAALIRELAVRGIVPLNGAVTDISKAGVQAQCRAFGLPTASADRQGDPSERVIVKTNLNFGGRAERQLAPAQLAAVGNPPLSGAVPDWTGYQVIRREQVLASWWDDPALAIERFIDNRADQFYRVNFAGDHVVILRLTNPNPLKKIRNSTARVDVYCRTDELGAGAVAGIAAPVAAVIAQYLERSGMDFGALEVIPDDAGQAFIIDVNSTCYAAVLNLWILAYLRRGLFARIASRATQQGRHLLWWDAAGLPTWPMLLGDAKRIARQFTARPVRSEPANDSRRSRD